MVHVCEAFPTPRQVHQPQHPIPITPVSHPCETGVHELGCCFPCLPQSSVSLVGSPWLRAAPAFQETGCHRRPDCSGPPLPSWPQPAQQAFCRNGAALECRGACQPLPRGHGATLLFAGTVASVIKVFGCWTRPLISWWHSVWPRVCPQPSGAPSDFCGRR